MNAQTPPVVTAELIQRIAPSEALLRAIQAGGWASLGDLADKSGRPAHNMKRDLGRLQDAGLVDLSAGTEKPALASAAVAGLAAIDTLANPVRDAEAGGEAPVWTHRDFTNNPDQPRKKFDDAAVAERAASMKDVGQLQNLLARPNPDKTPGAPALQIVAGETRWRAAGLLIERGDWSADHPIKTDVRDLTDEQVDRIALAENVQRSDLTTMEEARAYARMMNKYGWTTDQVADEVGKDRRTVQLRLRLLRLTPEQQQQLDDGEINYSQAQKIIDALPKPLDLTPVKAMILAEVVAAAAGDQGGAYHRKAECAASAANDPIAAALVQAGILTFEGPDHFTGGYTAKFTDYQVFDRFAQQYPAVIPADRSSGLLSIRAAALGADEAERLDSEDRYAAAWLNGPFELTEEGKAIAEQRRQEAAQQAVRAGEADAQRALRMKRLSEADGQANDLLKALAKPRVGALVEGFAEAFEGAEIKLPLTFGLSGGKAVLIDATGKAVEFPATPTPDATIRLKLIMAAVNAAAGLAPLIAEPEGAQPPEAQEPCPACEAARARAKEAGHRNWKDGFVCYDHAAVSIAEAFGEDAADDQGHGFEEDESEEA